MTRWIRRAAWAAAVVLAACDNLEDIYCDGSGRNGCEGGTPLPPFPDVGRFLHQDACVECLEMRCAKKLSTCMTDPVCWETYECHGDATNPQEHLDCDPTADEATLVDDARHFAAETSSPKADPWGDLMNCAANLGCDDACALGRDFSCVGQWDPESSFQPDDPITLIATARRYPFGSIADMEVAACADPTCLQPMGAVRTTDGVATLHVKISDNNAGFDGAIRFDVKGQEDLPEIDQIPTSYHWSAMPRDGREISVAILYAHGASAAYWKAVQIEFDASRPNIQLITEDCARQVAPGLHVETDADCAPLEECAYYWTEKGLDPILTETQRHGPASVAITPVGDTAPDLRIVHVETGRVVGRVARIAPAGSHVHAWVTPLTRAEQRQLDAERDAAAR